MENEILLGGGQKIGWDDALRLLATGNIEEDCGRLRWSSNFTFLLSVREDATHIKAVYKPQAGERPLWDFPDGTLCYRERGAFLISQALGWDIVPPTVLREGPRGTGSFQLYIDHNPEITYFNLGTSFVPQLQKFAAFDYIINNADRKGGHCLLGEGGKLWGIDHGIGFHASAKLRTVIWNFAGEPVEAELIADIDKLCGQLNNRESELSKQMQKLLSRAEYESLISRTQRLLKQGKYPQPGNGPCYPWPPI